MLQLLQCLKNCCTKNQRKRIIQILNHRQDKYWTSNFLCHNRLNKSPRHKYFVYSMDDINSWWTKILICYIFFAGLAECQLQHFLRTPDDTEVTEGDTAVLLCQVGNQIGQVQWTKDGLTLGKFQTSFPFINLFPEIFQAMTVSYPGLIVTQFLGRTQSVLTTYKWPTPVCTMMLNMSAK